MKFTEHAISAIVRALLNDRHDLSVQLAYWQGHGYTATPASSTQN
ncbi:hypothetical protein [Massilia sp. CT11-137]